MIHLPTFIPQTKFLDTPFAHNLVKLWMLFQLHKMLSFLLSNTLHYLLMYYKSLLKMTELTE